MHEIIDEAANSLGLELPALRKAADHSRHLRADAREFLCKATPPNDLPLDVLVLGSLAREEASGESDFDYLVISHALADDVRAARQLIRNADELCDHFALKRPGRTGMFGEVVSASDLVERIGLDQDTNLTHSRRILILEESASVYQPDLHQRLLRAVLERYLLNHDGTGVPRFLLNDVIRYWRTLAVDHEAKRWSAMHEDWGLRYLKLIISRKLVYAGTIATLLLTEAASIEYLYEQFSMPPLARLAQLSNRLRNEAPALEALRQVLQSADQFQASLASEEFRNAVKDVQDSNDPGREFSAAKLAAQDLQGHLQTIFYETDLLSARSRHYLGF